MQKNMTHGKHDMDAAQVQHALETTHLAHNGTGAGGNNKSPAPPKKSRGYMFTINNYTPGTLDTVLKYLEEGSEKYAMQEETGASGTPHLQGSVYFKNARSWESVRLPLGGQWVEPMHTKKGGFIYCLKDETRTGRRWTKGIPIPPKDPMEGLTPHQWQKDILEELKGEPHPRKIKWVWEPEGCAGKTTLAKHICITNPGAIYVSGAAKDIKYAITQCKVAPKIIIMGIPRTQEGHVSYQALEEVKDGLFFSPKYEASMFIMDPPHIIVMANFPPEFGKLSTDRWDIINLSREEEPPGVGLDSFLTRRGPLA